MGDKTLSLPDVRGEIDRQSGWSHSRTFEDVAAAIEIGIRPSVFWSWPEEDQAMVLAYFRAKGTMEEYAHFLNQKRIKQDQHKARRK